MPCPRGKDDFGEYEIIYIGINKDVRERSVDRIYPEPSPAFLLGVGEVWLVHPVLTSIPPCGQGARSLEYESYHAAFEAVYFHILILTTQYSRETYT